MSKDWRDRFPPRVTVDQTGQPISQAEYNAPCEYCKEHKILWAYYPYCSEICKHTGELLKRFRADPH